MCYSHKAVKFFCMFNLALKLICSLVPLSLMLAGCAAPSASGNGASQKDQPMGYTLQLQQESVEGISQFPAFVPASRN